MIRDYKQSDIEEIVRIYTLEYKAMPEEIETLRTAKKILVCDDNDDEGIKGFIHLIMTGNFCYAEMGVINDEQIDCVGLELWEECKKLFIEKSIHFVQTFHVKDNLSWQALFNKIGFEYWYSVYRFTYSGDKFNEPDICALKYEDKYFEDKIRLESEAFAVLREANDIRPYNWFLSASKEQIEDNRREVLKEKEYNYVFLENNEMVGASMIKNSEVDLLFVNIKYQRMGYGKKILEFTVNRGLEQNATVVNLNVLASNEKALKLYKNAGFKVVQAQDCRRLIIK